MIRLETKRHDHRVLRTGKIYRADRETRKGQALITEANRFAGIAVGVALFILCGGCHWDRPTNPTEGTSVLSECNRAAQEAAAAIAAGVITLKEYPPLPSPPSQGEYIQLLEERCGVEYEVISAVPPGVDAIAFGKEVGCWNEVMMKEIKRKNGEEIFNELEEEALTRWKTQAASQGK